MKNILTNVKKVIKNHFAFSGLLILFLLTTISSFSQDKNISGKITSSDGSGMPGVNILVKGTTIGTSSNAEGNYSINVPQNANTLIFSFIGFMTQEVAIGNQSNISIQLAEDTKQLGEVVVTALGIKKETRTIGYSAQDVKGEDLVKAREPNPINSLVGKIAGLTVGASTELLGKPTVILRGNTNLLYVVDGVPINSDTYNVSPDDIESYTVLKGPNASALYGSRGLNGAILITTKRGKGLSIEFNSSTMFERGFLAIPKVQSEYGPGEYYTYSFGDKQLGQGGVNNGDYDIWGPRFEGQPIKQYDGPIGADGKRVPTPWVARGKDNLKNFIQTGIISTNNLAISAGNEKFDLRASLTHSYQKGINPNTKLNVTTLNLNSGINFTPKLRLETNLNVNRQYTPNYPDVQYGPNSLIYNIIIWGGADWNVNDFNPNKGGSYWQPGQEGVQQIYAEYVKYNNPYFVSYEWLRGHYKTDIIGSSKLSYKINDFLNVSLRSQVTTWDQFRNEKFPYSGITYGRYDKQGDYREDKRNLFENNTDVLLTFDKNIFPDFNLKAYLGASLRTFQYRSSYGTTDYLLVPGVYNFSNSKNATKIYNYDAKMQVASAYYSLDFSYKNFINLSTTGRVDKSSNFPKSKDTYFYPSAAISTVISDFINMPSVISFLKIRGSYANVKEGLTSPTIGPAYSALGLSSPIGYGGAYGSFDSSYDGPSYGNSEYYNLYSGYNNQIGAVYSTTIANQSLKPSSQIAYETGFDIKFLQNRLSLDLTYFTNQNGPKIFANPISSTSGQASFNGNDLTTQKKGWEISLSGSPLKNPDGLNWNVLVNWSTYKETLKSYSQPTLSTFYKVGDRLDKYFGYTFYRSPSGQIIHDNSGLPLQDNQYPQFLGNTNPDWVWAINNRFSYKGITFSFQFDGRVGGVIQDYIRTKTFQGGRHIETAEGAYGKARLEESNAIKNNTPNYQGGYVGEGVVIASGTPKYENGVITNLSELTFAPNTKATFLQDYIGKTRDFSETDLISKTFGKLREITIGYTLPSKLLGKMFIKQASVSLVGRNLLYFAKYKDIDLDQYATGYNFATQSRATSSALQSPTTRRFGINLNLTF